MAKQVVILKSPIVEAPFRLTNSDPVLVAANGVALTWSDIWSYQVPNGTALLIKPFHTFSLYSIDAGAESSASLTQIKIEKRDASGSDILTILGPTLYYEVKEFQDARLLAHFGVPAEGVIINEREKLVICIKATTAKVITVANCYFEARIAKIRKTLNA